ncbi:MAG: tetratricopeptide repeat protein [Desulfobulbaceae bacterium]|nr:tetratricopeptide repeat protein [Desulfobulbaceae bacterium]
MKRKAYVTTSMMLLGGFLVLGLGGCTTMTKLSSWVPFWGGEKSYFQARQSGQVEAYFRAACLYQKKNQHRRAIDEFEKVLREDPRHVKAYNGMGVSYDQRGDYRRAVGCYEAALRLDRDLDYVYNNLGYCHLLQGNADAAITAFHQAIALDRDNGRYHNNLGLAYSLKGEIALAVAAFKFGGATVAAKAEDPAAGDDAAASAAVGEEELPAEANDDPPAKEERVVTKNSGAMTEPAKPAVALLALPSETPRVAPMAPSNVPPATDKVQKTIEPPLPEVASPPRSLSAAAIALAFSRQSLPPPPVVPPVAISGSSGASDAAGRTPAAAVAKVMPAADQSNEEMAPAPVTHVRKSPAPATAKAEKPREPMRLAAASPEQSFSVAAAALAPGRQSLPLPSVVPLVATSGSSGGSDAAGKTTPAAVAKVTPVPDRREVVEALPVPTTPTRPVVQAVKPSPLPRRLDVAATPSVAAAPLLQPAAEMKPEPVHVVVAAVNTIPSAPPQSGQSSTPVAAPAPSLHGSDHAQMAGAKSAAVAVSAASDVPASASMAVTPSAEGEKLPVPNQLVACHAWGIEVVNGNGGLGTARKWGAYLAGRGNDVMRIANADHFHYATTTVYYCEGYLQEAYQLAKEIPLYQNMARVTRFDNPHVKIKVVIGQDLARISGRFLEKIYLARADY